MVSVTLVSCAVTLVWFRRRYSASQQTLRDVKTLAYNILASMDQGVITVGRDGTITSINSAAIRLLGMDADCRAEQLSSVYSSRLPFGDWRSSLPSSSSRFVTSTLR